MEDKFTKLNLNGVEKYVSAIYDGSGNDITATYETKIDATSKETALSGRITTVSEALEALTGRVTITEGFATEIENNKNNIQTNLESINALKEVDKTFQESLNTLTIQVNENKTNISDAKNTIGTLSNSFLGLNSKVSTLEAVINDEASGINALNTQADQNTADIATVNGKVTELQTQIGSKVSQEVFEALLARVEALEQALATNHPS